METRFKDTNTDEIYTTSRIELDTIKEHKHSEGNHNYWHPADRIHSNNIETYVCISCEKPCVMITNTTPYGCLSHHKHKNSQWKETNKIIDHTSMPSGIVDTSKYIDFGDFSRHHLGLSCQQGSKYVDGVIDNYPELGQGLRFLGDNHNYHSLKIHKDDVQTFMNRFNDYMETK